MSNTSTSTVLICKLRFLCLFSVISFISINSGYAQSISTKIEKTITNDLTLLFQTIESDTTEYKTLVDYSESIMKRFKKYKKGDYFDKNEYITYSKSIKARGDLVTANISFFANPHKKSQILISYYFYHYPTDVLDSLYHNILKLNFGKRQGFLCSGNKVYASTKKGYVALVDKNFITGFSELEIYPFDFIFKDDGWSDSRFRTFGETIIFDSLPTLPEFNSIRDSIELSNNFSYYNSSLDSFEYHLSFFQLSIKEWDEYIRNNIDRLQTNPDPNELYRISELLQINKRKELNLRWFSIRVQKVEHIHNNATKSIHLNLALNSIPNIREHEIEELEAKLSFGLRKANLNNLIAPLAELVDLIKKDDLEKKFL